MTRSFLRFAAISLSFACGFSSLHAQSALASLRPVSQSNRVAVNPDFGPQTQLTGHLPAWVRNGSSVASQAVDLSANMHITIVVQRDPAVQAAFEQFLADQQTPGNPLYHQWLTPQQVGTLFGPTASDLAAVTNWLTAQGLTIDQISNSQVVIDAHGSATAIASAFRTSFAYYPLNGTPRLSATSEPYVPTALSPVINSIFGLTDMPLNPLSHISGPHQPALPQGSSSNLKPQYTSASSGNHYVTPNDFATIFDINSVYGTNTGATIGSKAQHIAIIGRSYVATSDITEYITNMASSFNINNLVAITPPGATAPGPVCTFANQSTCTTSGDQGEQTLDVDRVIGTAPGAYVDLIVSTSINSDISYNVNSLVDPVMTVSYGLCELSSSSASYNTINNYFSTGAAEGISTFVSSGDGGANGCANDGTAITSTGPASVNYICSSSYATCVGGTEFNDTASPSTYWLSANGTGDESAISYIPEGGWNEPSGDCATAGTYCPLASGGGVSIFNTTKPAWQTGTGVPGDSGRDTPDVAYPGAGHDGFYACMDFALSKSTQNCTSAGGGYFFDFFGTSAAAPSMAGVAALLNTKLGAPQGNLNPLLYKLAATPSNNVFHDTTVLTSGVTGCSITVPSMCNNSTPGSSADSTTVAGGLQGFLLTTGYDEVTGWGSIDVANFLAAAASTPTFNVTPATTAYTVNSATTTSTTDLITFASKNGFAGVVNYTCMVTNGSGTAPNLCSLGPISGTLTANGTTTSTLTITNTALASGVLNVTVQGTSGTTVATSATIAVNLVPPSFSLSPPNSLNISPSGATTGNTTATTVTSTNGFAGTVSFTCTAVASSGSPASPATCSASSVTLTSGGTGTSTITIASTTAQAQKTVAQAALTGWGIKGGALLAAMLCLVPFRRRRFVRPLAAFALLAFCMAAFSGCSSSAAPVKKSSDGTYTVTVTGTGTTTGATTATTASTTFSLTISN